MPRGDRVVTDTQVLLAQAGPLGPPGHRVLAQAHHVAPGEREHQQEAEHHGGAVIAGGVETRVTHRGAGCRTLRIALGALPSMP